MVWFSAGMSNVEATTSPLMERCMSVTSSGRSSTSRHDEIDLRVVGGDGLADALEHRGLAGLGRTHDQAALTLADGSHEVNGATGYGITAVFHAKTLIGVDGREVAEARARADKLGLEAIDRGDLVKRGILVVGAARANGSLDPVAAAKAHVLDHLLGNEGVVITGHVVAGANEAIALARDVKHASDVVEALGTRGGNVDRLYKLGLADTHVLNAEVNRLATQLRHEHGGGTLARERGAAVVVARAVAVVVVTVTTTVVAAIVVLELALALCVLFVSTAARANVATVALIAALLPVGVLATCLRRGVLASLGRRGKSLVAVLAGARATTLERPFVTGGVGFGGDIRLGSDGRLLRGVGLGCVIRPGRRGP